MKFFGTLALLAGFAAALPTTDVSLDVRTLETRQRGGFSSSSRNDLLNGGPCPGSIFIFARGTSESGNLGSLGNPLGSALSTQLKGNVWVQGVGGAYTANFAGNVNRDGASPAAIKEMVGLMERAAKTCPNAKIVAGGFSQGAALAAGAIRDVNATVKSKVVGAVLFGYPKNKVNKGQIINFPVDRTKVFCAVGDAVCDGRGTITAAHLGYGPDARGPAATFLVSKI